MDLGPAEEDEDRPVHPAVLPVGAVWETVPQARRARVAAVQTFQL
jgi:hypothetical protein